MEPEKKSYGALIGSIIIIIILIIGGLYIWQSQMKDTLSKKEAATTVTAEDDALLNSLTAEVGGADTNIDLDLNTVQ